MGGKEGDDVRVDGRCDGRERESWLPRVCSVWGRARPVRAPDTSFPRWHVLRFESGTSLEWIDCRLPLAYDRETVTGAFSKRRSSMV